MNDKSNPSLVSSDLSPTKHLHHSYDAKTFRVALVGRTNAGKSSLFNALTKGQRVIVSSKKHVTRDAIYGFLARDTEGARCPVELIDLAGFDAPSAPLAELKINYGAVFDKKSDYLTQLKKRTRDAIFESDLIVAVFDITRIEKEDREMLRWLRKNLQKKELTIVFNKIDLDPNLDFANDLRHLETSDGLFVSAQSRQGLAELVEEICKRRDLLENSTKQESFSASKKRDNENDLLKPIKKSTQQKNGELDKGLVQNQAILHSKKGSTDEKQEPDSYDRERSTPIESTTEKKKMNDENGVSKQKEENFFQTDIDEKLQEEKLEFDRERKSRLVLLGKPNAGKSSLFNALLKEERSLVSDMPGTTRDAISSSITMRGVSLQLFDTAGLRQYSKISEQVEEQSFKRALSAMRAASLAILLVDSTEPISEQDKKIALLALKNDKALIMVFNKWDLVKQSWKDFLDRQLFLFPQMRNFNVLAVSAKTGYHLSLLSKKIIQLMEATEVKLPTAKLNKLLQEAVERTPPPSSKKMILSSKNSARKKRYGVFKKFKLLYAVQLNTLPFHVKIFCRHREALTDAYRTYLTSYLRRSLDLQGVPLKLTFSEEERRKLSGERDNERAKRK